MTVARRFNGNGYCRFLADPTRIKAPPRQLPSPQEAPVNTCSAPDILIAAADAISDRASLRDQPNGERSMARAVASFNAIYGTDITELQGWQFMVLLKMARSVAGRVNVDDFTDAAAYAALAGECAQRSPIRHDVSICTSIYGFAEGGHTGARAPYVENTIEAAPSHHISGHP